MQMLQMNSSVRRLALKTLRSIFTTFTALADLSHSRAHCRPAPESAVLSLSPNVVTFALFWPVLVVFQCHPLSLLSGRSGLELVLCFSHSFADASA